MKMVRQKAPSKDIGKRQDMMSHFPDKEQIVFPIVKDPLPVIAFVVYVIDASGFEVHSICYCINISILISSPAGGRSEKAFKESCS